MNFFVDFFSNRFLIVVVASWFFSQLLKGIIHAIVYKEWDIKRFFGDGGMPSAHSATVSSLMTFAGITYGFDSFEFAVCAIFAIIVCRDAVGVRWETGKQAMVLNDLRRIIESEETDDIKLKEFVGHNPVQVVAGFLLGIAVAALMSLIL